MHTGAIIVNRDASGSCLGSARQLRFPDVIVRQFSSTVLVFHDFEDVVLFSRAGYC